MNTYDVKELVEGKGPITVTLVPGYGDGYTEAQLDLIDGHVSDIVERIRELNRAAVVTISPMNTSTPVRVAEFTMLSLGESSDIILLVTPSHVKVDKWRGHRDRIGCYIGN